MREASGNLVHIVMSEPEAAFLAWSAKMAAHAIDVDIHDWESNSDSDMETLVRLISTGFTARKIQYEIQGLLFGPESVEEEIREDVTSDEIDFEEGNE